MNSEYVWENERTPTSVRRFGVRLHTAGLSIGETVVVLKIRGVERPNGAIWQWVCRLADSGADPPTGRRARVACPRADVERTPKTSHKILSRIVGLDSGM